MMMMMMMMMGLKKHRLRNFKLDKPLARRLQSLNKTRILDTRQLLMLLSRVL